MGLFNHLNVPGAEERQGLNALSMLQPSLSNNMGNKTQNTAQLKSIPYSQKLVDLVTGSSGEEDKPKPSNNTGIPTQMKENFEAKSGLSFDDVKVHYNSDKPAQLQALAYTQGNQVYVAPGQEKHLGHELGHVVQQKQGRVKPNLKNQSININNDLKLENEATELGEIANPSVETVQKMADKKAELDKALVHIDEVASVESPKKTHAKHMKAGGKIAPSDIGSFEQDSIDESALKSKEQAKNRIDKKYIVLLNKLEKEKEFKEADKTNQEKKVTQL